MGCPAIQSLQPAMLTTEHAETAITFATATFCCVLTRGDVGEAWRIQGPGAGLLAQAGVDLAQLLVQPLQLVLALPGGHACMGSSRLIACSPRAAFLLGLSNEKPTGRQSENWRECSRESCHIWLS